MWSAADFDFESLVLRGQQEAKDRGDVDDHGVVLCGSVQNLFDCLGNHGLRIVFGLRILSDIDEHQYRTFVSRC